MKLKKSKAKKEAIALKDGDKTSSQESNQKEEIKKEEIDVNHVEEEMEID